MRQTTNQRSSGRHPRSAGFSLVELLVGLAVTSMLLLAIVGVFDAGTKVARVETQVADMQQSLRAGHRLITRMVRMAGRGGLPLTLANVPVFQGPALSFRNEAGVAPDNGQIAVGFAGSPVAVAGSDILISRGVLNTPVYQIDTLDPAVFSLVDGDLDGNFESGTIVVRDMTPTGTPQDLTPLVNADTALTPEALVLVSPTDERIFAVVELDPATTAQVGNQITVGFKVQGMTHPEYRNLYESGPGGNPVLPAGLTSAAFLGIVEEYRFYVRQPTPPSPPVLSMARMFPGTETPYLGTLGNARIDLADHVLDMQVALAFDTAFADPAAPGDRNGDGVTDEDDMEIFEQTGMPIGANDDWLFNAAVDDETLVPWAGAAPQPELFFVRVSLLARTARRERNYQAPTLVTWEDVSDARLAFWNTFPERLYKRRLQQTTIELRNL